MMKRSEQFLNLLFPQQSLINSAAAINKLALGAGAILYFMGEESQCVIWYQIVSARLLMPACSNEWCHRLTPELPSQPIRGRQAQPHNLMTNVGWCDQCTPVLPRAQANDGFILAPPSYSGEMETHYFIPNFNAIIWSFYFSCVIRNAEKGNSETKLKHQSDKVYWLVH